MDGECKNIADRKFVLNGSHGGSLVEEPLFILVLRRIMVTNKNMAINGIK